MLTRDGAIGKAMTSSGYGIIHLSGTDMHPLMWAQKRGEQQRWVVVLERKPPENMKHKFYVTEMVCRGDSWWLLHDCPKHYSHTLTDAAQVFAKLAGIPRRGTSRKGRNNG